MQVWLLLYRMCSCLPLILSSMRRMRFLWRGRWSQPPSLRFIVMSPMLPQVLLILLHRRVRLIWGWGKDWRRKFLIKSIALLGAPVLAMELFQMPLIVVVFCSTLCFCPTLSPISIRALSCQLAPEAMDIGKDLGMEGLGEGSFSYSAAPSSIATKASF